MKSTLCILFVFMLVPTIAFSQAASRPSYVGYKYKSIIPLKTLPNGVKHLGGGMIGNIDADPAHGISQVQKGKTKMLWLETSTGMDDSGITGWKVLDVLSFPAMAKADYLFFVEDPSIYCRKNGDDIKNLVGVGRIVRTQGIFRPSKLWIANLTTRKFVPLKLTGVKCEYSEP